VGTRTARQVLGNANFPVGHGFILRLPAAGWYTWSGSIIEGSGVTPDISVPLQVSTLRDGKDNELDAAIAVAATFPTPVFPSITRVAGHSTPQRR